MNSSQVRESLIRTLRLDLVGPEDDHDYQAEILPNSPSRWYLTGFLAPLGAKPEEKSDEESFDELEATGDSGGVDDDDPPEKRAAKRTLFPSSVGISCLVSKSEPTLNIEISWGDYRPQRDGKFLDTNSLVAEAETESSSGEGGSEASASDSIGKTVWVRTPRKEMVEVRLDREMYEVDVPNSGGLKVAVTTRPTVDIEGDESPTDTKAVGVFVVNYREPYHGDYYRDVAFAFQVHLSIHSSKGFVPRPNIKGALSDDPDERIADLQYRDIREFAVGHGIATNAIVAGSQCQTIESSWMPTSEVEKVEARKVENVELGMERLAGAPDSRTLQTWLTPLVEQYRAWIKTQTQGIPGSPKTRKDTATDLLKRAEDAARRIEAGISCLSDPKVFEAFKIANRTMATAARQRNSVINECKPEEVSPPAWRPFQLAFVLLNLVSIEDPKSVDRNRIVDLLFFPTGGGKTEAYLGLSAFTLVLRRLKDPSKYSAGITVLMRYTLRLLTLDQLGRASTLICALELERQKNPEKLGPWPFEIGLWVGKGATPNRMGSKGDNDQSTARAKTIAFQNNSKKPSPIPLENCPWCGTKFDANSFRLRPNRDNPTDLDVSCLNRDCEFSGGRHLPILAVDEPIYRRLPCFLIATVDKFAALPWVGESGALFGHVDRQDQDGFYHSSIANRGTAIPGGRLPPPELIIQDELHLISGPMGTMVGLYEGAIDELCSRMISETKVMPKIVASTATVRRAERQIQALFNRRNIQIFPPPGPNVRDSFFALTKSRDEANARLYLGVAAQGRSSKVTLLRTYLALLSAAQKLYDKEGGKNLKGKNSVDPYMTLLGYFNSLRELGGSRRIVEDEIKTRLSGYARRTRVGETDGPFVNREIRHEPVELTSRVPTNEVSEAKRQLSLAFSEKERVDVALATNMISVGLDITRLGLMVVFGQPKTTAEYIQTTSRVGREATKPGLVVTLFNIHKHRDRSHYERFSYYHQTFYRSVEVTSVTPFSPRALDKGLAGAVVSLARHGLAAMTAPRGAGRVLEEAENLKFVVDSISQRAADYKTRPPEECERIRQDLRRRIEDLFDKWKRIALQLRETNTQMQYNQREIGNARALLHDFLDSELADLPREYRHFRANRSMRDVESSVQLQVKTIDNRDVEEEA